MGTLALTMACLLVGQVADDVSYQNKRTFTIPINIEDSRRAEVRELLLYASWDQGQTYQQVAAVFPDKKAFVFTAMNDGLCWLKAAVINRQGKQEPENIQKGRPDQKVIIDTMKPVMKTFEAQRQGDDIALSWVILEEHFDATGFRLEYQARDNPSAFWTNVPIPPGLTGQTRFRPTNTAPLNLRLIARDLAGNQSIATATVDSGITTAGYAPPPNRTNFPATVTDDLPKPPPPSTIPNTSSTFVPPPQPVDPPKGAQQQQQTNNNWAPIEPKEKLVATSEAPRPPVAPPPVLQAANNVTLPVVPPRRVLPPLQYVNHPEVLLKYALHKVGKSGIGSVELWWTKDDGQSWELYATDPDSKGSTQNGEHERTVELPGEGVFGFNLVVKSRAGLGKPPPKAGDAPDIRVEVDTTPPVAQLYAPVPDPQHPGALILKWAARDNNLSNNPVTLEWAEQRDGTWNPIVVDIPNNGHYSWQLPDNLPVQVYMRLRVHDLAGNESVATTQEPQLVDLSEPEGQLLTVTPSPRRP
jgi:hypothetical protein